MMAMRSLDPMIRTKLMQQMIITSPTKTVKQMKEEKLENRKIMGDCMEANNTLSKATKCLAGPATEEYARRTLCRRGLHAEKYSRRNHPPLPSGMSERGYILADGIVHTSQPAFQMESPLYRASFHIPRTNGLLLEIKARLSSAGTSDDKISHCEYKYEGIHSALGYTTLVIAAGQSERTMHLRGYFGQCYDHKCKCHAYAPLQWQERQQQIQAMHNKHIFIIPMSAIHTIRF